MIMNLIGFGWNSLERLPANRLWQPTLTRFSSNFRFKDCGHQTEPGCAVLQAVKNGFFDPKRLESHYKLKKKFSYLEDRQSMTADAMEKANYKKSGKKRRDFSGIFDNFTPGGNHVHGYQ